MGGSRPSRPGWACSSTTCCCSPASTSSGRSSASRSTWRSWPTRRVEDARAADPDRTYVLATEGPVPEVLGDTDRLHQVIANLLAKVREHCPPGTSARVEVSTVGEAPEPAWVQVGRAPTTAQASDPAELARGVRAPLSRRRLAHGWRQRPRTLHRAGRGRVPRRAGRLLERSGAGGTFSFRLHPISGLDPTSER